MSCFGCNRILFQEILHLCHFFIHSIPCSSPALLIILIIPSRVRRRRLSSLLRSPFAISLLPSFRYRAHYIAYTKPEPPPRRTTERQIAARNAVRNPTGGVQREAPTLENLLRHLHKLAYSFASLLFFTFN